jgi:CRISPR-associated exonuclease Cas4
MEVTPSLFGIYHVCKRECWLHANGIQMEHTSDVVYEGKLLSEEAYPQRPEQYTELKVENGKIDFFDPYNHVIYEIKKSPKQEDAHIWQVKHYIFLVNKLGLFNVKGMLSYPKQKKQTEVLLSDEEVNYIERTLGDVQALINQSTCPPVINKPICKSCSYYEFCYG